MAQPTAEFEAWLKSSDNMKLSYDRSVDRLVAEGVTDFESLTDFDKKSIQSLPKTLKEMIPQISKDVGAGILAQRAIPGAVLSTISVHRLITAVNAAEYYTLISRTMSVDNMYYDNVLESFKVEWETYQDLRDLDEPDVSLISDKENDRKVIKWVSVFQDCTQTTSCVSWSIRRSSSEKKWELGSNWRRSQLALLPSILAIKYLMSILTMVPHVGALVHPSMFRALFQMWRTTL